MKQRFRKVWCASCGTMQFAGECPHPVARVEAPPLEVLAQVRRKFEGPSVNVVEQLKRIYVGPLGKVLRKYLGL